MEYIIALLVIIVLTTVIVYKTKKKAALRRTAELEKQLAENNRKIAEERKARRERIESRYPTTSGQTTYTPPTRTFVKREESTPMYVPSATQSVTLHNDSVTDTLVNAMILDAVMHHHEPHFSGGSNPVDFPKVESDRPSASTSYSSSSSDSSYSSSSRDSSYSSSSSDSSYSSSSSDSSYSSSSSSDW